MAKANAKMDSHDLQQSLLLHFESDSENINSTDLNDTLEYEDYSLMDTGASATLSSSKRNRSDFETSDTDVTSSKKHNVSGRTATGSIDYQNQNVDVIVIAESENVNLGKINPILVAKTINDLVGSVHKVFSTKNGIKIICQKSQANLLTKEKKIKTVTKPKAKGITHGIPLEIELLEIKEKLKNSNTVKIEKIYRLEKFDKVKQEKIDTESVIIENNQDIEFPFQKYEHVSHI